MTYVLKLQSILKTLNKGTGHQDEYNAAVHYEYCRNIQEIGWHKSSWKL